MSALTPIEELDWYLENPGEPSVVHLETHIRGGLDRGALERALAVAVAADPASRRRLAASSAWRRHPRWDVTPGAIPPVRTVTWADAGELDALRESLTTVPVPLTSGVARLTLAVGPGRDVLFLQVHHAAFDGISALVLLSAIGDAYRSLAPLSVPAQSPPVSPLPPLSLDARDDGSAYARATAMTPARARGGARFPGAVVRVEAGRSGPARPGYGFVQWTAPVPEVTALPRAAGAGGLPGDRPRPTVNDLLITALMLAVRRWNRRRPGGRISVCVPVNTRDPEHRWTGPGNQSRLIRVSAAPAGCDAGPAELLAAVAEQTRRAREHPSPGLDGTSRLLATGWAPAGVKRAAARVARRLASPLVTDTALVSNLGVVPSPPSFTGDGAPVWFCGPAPMPRGIGVGVLTVGGRLHLTLVYSRALLDGPAAADFAALVRLALADLAPSRPPRRDTPEREAS